MQLLPGVHEYFRRSRTEITEVGGVFIHEQETKKIKVFILRFCFLTREAYPKNLFVPLQHPNICRKEIGSYLTDRANGGLHPTLQTEKVEKPRVCSFSYLRVLNEDQPDNIKQ